MIPIVTPDEMAEIDAAASEPVEVLIERAGRAVARAAVDLMGGTYGRRVVVIAGRGNNGADGRVAATALRGRGVAVVLLEAGSVEAVSDSPRIDLVIDAAYGTGLGRPYDWPSIPADVPILAVDLVSGCDGLTGGAANSIPAADATVTFAALKPGLLLSAGKLAHADVRVADIGLDVSGARSHLVESADVASWLPSVDDDRHKWKAAVWAIAGSPGMTGAASLCASAALRAGAGYVRLSTASGALPAEPIEAVHGPTPAAADWPADSERFGAIAIGPGLSTSSDAASLVGAVLTTAPVPVVVDGDGLTLLASTGASLTTKRDSATVLTPHDGEYERLMGERPSADRFLAVRRLAQRYGCVALLKGPTTLVADADGNVLAIDAGSPALSTAGTGDVLTGIIAALLAQGMPALHAAASGAFLHGRAAQPFGSSSAVVSVGLRASDLPGRLPEVRRRLLDE